MFLLIMFDVIPKLTVVEYLDAGVMMAARSLIQLFRAVNPALLHKKDRGKPTEESKDITVKQYGELKTTDFVPGTEVQCVYVYTIRLVLSIISAIWQNKPTLWFAVYFIYLLSTRLRVYKLDGS